MVKTWSIFHYFPIKGGWSPIHHSVSFRPPEFQVGLQRSNLAIDKLRQFHPLIDDLFPIQLPKPIRGYVSPIKPTICRWFSHQTHHLWIVFPCFPHSTHLFWIFLDDFPIEKAGFRLVWTLTAQVVLGPNYDPRRDWRTREWAAGEVQPLGKRESLQWSLWYSNVHVYTQLYT